ncbi:acyltransferase domain-containing protein [Aristaeella lactis]|uniref:Uncharacterized protein n=1 Tax=Aristaeella lactis TaxID=3046383 RepID=A0AC61PI13_9FIRM|nr:acyltransferase domain-containing protein [Aristaeella lactis]QUA53603.1 hypothetical protein JYE50_02915 [Aristaeella lactis]SMC37420.1 hypothetical protein SAMN06297397_0381 [Aristaeella lactis]
MTTERLDELLRITGNIIPEAMEEHISDLEADEKELLPRETLLSVLTANHVPAEKQAALLEALEEANKVPELVELAHVMAKDAVRGLVRCHAVEFHQPRPECLTGFAREAYAFLYTQLCVLEGRKALRKRGIPEEYDADIPERMTRKQLKKYAETGDISFDDYPWDMNFYCCQIFFLDRFYFIPYRWGGSPEAWRNTETGEVTALWHAGVRIRRDGQIDGVNGIHDPEAFTTVFRETNDTVTGNRVLPEGLVSPEVVTLDKKTWRKALGDDDYLLALHIPGGEGYTPERVKSSCEKALAFYDRYYPEYHYIGFWSESWLYDPGLREIVKPDRNIVRVQKQFYCYPVEEGDRMIRLEVLGDENADYRKLTPRNSLERGMFDVWARGDRFHTTGMFLLREEVPQIGKNPYET